MVQKRDNTYVFYENPDYQDYQETPLPEDGYHAIAIPKEYEKEFLIDENRYLYDELGSYDELYLTEKHSTYKYLTLVFYDYQKMAWALNEIEKFFQCKTNTI